MEKIPVRIRYDHDEFSSLLIVRKGLKKEELLRNAGATAGYASVFFGKVYDCVFAESENLHESYEKYYWCEYGSFREYISHEFLLDNHDVEQLFSVLDADENLTLLFWPRFSYGENELPELIFSEEHVARFTKLLSGLE